MWIRCFSAVLRLRSSGSQRECLLLLLSSVFHHDLNILLSPRRPHRAHRKGNRSRLLRDHDRIVREITPSPLDPPCHSPCDHCNHRQDGTDHERPEVRRQSVSARARFRLRASLHREAPRCVLIHSISLDVESVTAGLQSVDSESSIHGLVAIATPSIPDDHGSVVVVVEHHEVSRLTSNEPDKLDAVIIRTQSPSQCVPIDNAYFLRERCLSATECLLFLEATPLIVK